MKVCCQRGKGGFEGSINFNLPTTHVSEPQCWLGHVTSQDNLLNIALSSEKISLFLKEKKKKSAMQNNLLHWMLNLKAEKDHSLFPSNIISKVRKRSPGRPKPLDLTQ